MQFALDATAADFIREHGGAVVIDLKFRHSIGDGILAGLEGSYIPSIRLGEPAEHPHPYDRTMLGGAMLYHARGLEPKPGCRTIGIKLRSFAVFRWLEIEGAKHIPVFTTRSD